MLQFALAFLLVLECSISADIDHRKVALEQLHSMSDQELDQDLKLQDFFGSIYVINLPHATTRLARMTQDLKKIGVHNFTVWPAVNGRNPQEVPEALWRKMSLNWRVIDLSSTEGEKRLARQFQGETGCYLSHYRLLQHVKAQYDLAQEQWRIAADPVEKDTAAKEMEKYSSVLILEDDNGFGIVQSDHKNVSLAGVGKLLRLAFSELPDDWDMLYLMAQSISPSRRQSPHLKQLKFGMLMNAYAVSHRMYGDIIRHLSSIDDLATEALTPVDNAVGELHTTHQCYAIYPSIALQADGESQIIDQMTKGPRQVQP